MRAHACARTCACHTIFATLCEYSQCIVRSHASCDCLEVCIAFTWSFLLDPQDSAAASPLFSLAVKTVMSAGAIIVSLSPGISWAVHIHASPVQISSFRTARCPWSACSVFVINTISPARWPSSFSITNNSSIGSRMGASSMGITSSGCASAPCGSHVIAIGSESTAASTGRSLSIIDCSYLHNDKHKNSIAF